MTWEDLKELCVILFEVAVFVVGLFVFPTIAVLLLG